VDDESVSQEIVQQEIVRQIVDEIFSSLEPLDTQNTALLQFLKDKGIVQDEAIAPYLEQAGKASGVRWLAARVRINSLIASAVKNVGTKPVEKKSEETKPPDTQAPGTQAKGATEKKFPESAEKANKKDQTIEASERRDSTKKDAKAEAEKTAAVAEEDNPTAEHQSAPSDKVVKQNAA
jgi:hypothetical protein